MRYPCLHFPGGYSNSATRSLSSRMFLYPFSLTISPPRFHEDKSIHFTDPSWLATFPERFSRYNTSFVFASDTISGEYPLMRYIHSSLTFPIGTRYRSIHIYQRLLKFLFPSFCPHSTPRRVYALHEIPDIFRRKPPRKITRRCWIRYLLRSHCI